MAGRRMARPPGRSETPAEPRSHPAPRRRGACSGPTACSSLASPACVATCGALARRYGGGISQSSQRSEVDTFSHAKATATHLIVPCLSLYARLLHTDYCNRSHRESHRELCRSDEYAANHSCLCLAKCCRHAKDLCNSAQHMHAHPLQKRITQTHSTLQRRCTFTFLVLPRPEQCLQNQSHYRTAIKYHRADAMHHSQNQAPITRLRLSQISATQGLYQGRERRMDSLQLHQMSEMFRRRLLLSARSTQQRVAQ